MFTWAFNVTLLCHAAHSREHEALESSRIEKQRRIEADEAAAEATAELGKAKQAAMKAEYAKSEDSI